MFFLNLYSGFITIFNLTNDYDVMMLMQKASQDQLDLTFPKKYLQRFEEYQRRRVEIVSKPRRPKRTSATPKVFSSNCKQAISLASKVYCCVLKELVGSSLCKRCPCYEREPLEYSLFRRV